MVDSSGRNVRQRTDEALYLKRDPSTWTLEPSCRHGPPAFWFFSVFLATQLESLPLPAQGLTRAQFTKVLVNTQFLFAGATSMDGMASTMAAAGGSPHGATLWQSGLQSLLEALELLDACGAVLGRWSKQATHCHVRGCF